MVGVDVEPGWPRRFSVAVVEDGRLVARYEGVSAARLLRLLWELRPELLAVDNVMELGSDLAAVRRFLSLLPPGTSVVQVTRLPGGVLRDLRSLAAEAGIDVGSKLTPGRAAYVAALLALRGYGCRVRFKWEGVRVVVRRARGHGRGGWSQGRFQRAARASVLRATRLVQAALEDAGLDFDVVIRRSDGGADSAVFTVYAPLEAVRRVVKPGRVGEAVVEVRPVYGGGLAFEEPRGVYPAAPTSGRPLIVGVDPGVRSAVAAVDLTGELVLLESRRGLDRAAIIELIREHGSPVVVATDVRPAPEAVRRLAATLGVPVYEPPRSLSVVEKQELVEKYLAGRGAGLQLDSHMRDALAAALKALHSLLPKLAQAEAYVERLGVDIDVEAVKAAVARGVSIAEAVEAELARLLEEEEPQPPPQPQRGRGEGGGGGASERWRLEAEKLRAENEALRARIRELEEELERLRGELRLVKAEVDARVEADRRVAELRARLQAVTRELEEVRVDLELLRGEAARLRRALAAAARGEAVVAVVARTLSPEALREARSALGGLRGVPLLLAEWNPVYQSLLGELASEGVAAVLVPRGVLVEAREVAKQHKLPVLPLEEYPAELVTGSIVLLPPEVLLDAGLERARIEAELEEERRRAEERRIVTLEELEEMLRRYREERARELMGGEGGY